VGYSKTISNAKTYPEAYILRAKIKKEINDTNGACEDIQTAKTQNGKDVDPLVSLYCN
jgi:hypothetical protein